MLLTLLVLALFGAAFFGWLYFRELKRSSEYLERAQLVQQEKLIVVDFMHDMVQALGEGLSKDELFQRIAHASIVSTGALSACVFEKGEGDMMRAVAVEGLYPPHRPIPEKVRSKLATRAKFLESVLRTEAFSVKEGIVGECARSGKPILIENGRMDSRIVKHDDPALVVSTVICAPIKFGERVLGVLSVCNSADGLPFSSTDFSVVQSLAEQAGIAIHNNEFLTLQLERKQIDVDLQIARNIQLMLLPQALPEVPGLEIDARYVSSHTIGGDLYDVIRIDEHVLGIAVADVSGKGIPASIIMAMCRTNLHRVALEHRSPARVLSLLNHALYGDIQDGLYVSVLYAVIDTQKGEIVYARGGHERPLVCTVDDLRGMATASYPESEGMPIGIFEPALFDAAIEERTVPFNPGDIFVAYTDGVIESMNSVKKEYSAARLADSVKTLRKRPAAEVNDGVLESLVRFSGKRSYDDDLTLVTVKRV